MDKFLEQKKEFTCLFVNSLITLFYEGIKSIYDNINISSCKNDIVKNFQLSLSKISK